MSRFRSLLILSAPLALLAATGCAQNFNANVSRFQAMPSAQGQSFAIKSADAKLDGSLEFATYARLVSSKMTALGYREAAPGETPNLILSMDYTVDQGKEKSRRVPGYSSFDNCLGFYDPWCSRYYGYGRYGSRYNWGRGAYYSGFYDPFLFGGRYDDVVEEYTVYTSGLNVNISKPGTTQRVFEGKAQAMSLSNNLTHLVPNLVEAMFTGFPGNSGETVRITVPLSKKRS